MKLRQRGRARGPERSAEGNTPGARAVTLTASTRAGSPLDRPAPPPLRLNLLGGFELIRCGRSVPVALGSQRLVSFLALQTRPVLEALCVGCTEEGRAAAAIAAGLAAVAAEPLRESSHRVLVEAHLSEGNQAEALRQYLHYRDLLRDNLGVEPSPRITSLVAP